MALLMIGGVLALMILVTSVSMVLTVGVWLDIVTVTTLLGEVDWVITMVVDGVEIGGVETGGVETGGVETGGVETGGVESGGVETGGVKIEGVEVEGIEVEGV